MSDSTSKVVQSILIKGNAKLGKSILPNVSLPVEIGSKVDRNAVMSAYNAFSEIESVSFMVDGKSVSLLKPVNIADGQWLVDGKPVKVDPHMETLTLDQKDGTKKETTLHSARQDFHEVVRGVLHSINPVTYLAFNSKAGGGSVKDETVNRIKACKSAGMTIETTALVTGKKIETVKRVFDSMK